MKRFSFFIFLALSSSAFSSPIPTAITNENHLPVEKGQIYLGTIKQKTIKSKVVFQLDFSQQKIVGGRFFYEKDEPKKERPLVISQDQHQVTLASVDPIGPHGKQERFILPSSLLGPENYPEAKALYIEGEGESERKFDMQLMVVENPFVYSELLQRTLRPRNMAVYEILLSSLLEKLLTANDMYFTYFWDVVVARPYSTPIKDRYNPQHSPYITWQLEKQQPFAPLLAKGLLAFPRDPQFLQGAFDYWQPIFSMLIPRHIYKEKFAPYVQALLKVHAHWQTRPQLPERMKSISEHLAEQLKQRGLNPARDPYPSKINPFSKEVFADFYLEDSGLGDETKNLWAHGFWYRRYQEGNFAVVAGIFKTIEKLNHD